MPPHVLIQKVRAFSCAIKMCIKLFPSLGMVMVTATCETTPPPSPRRKDNYYVTCYLGNTTVAATVCSNMSNIFLCCLGNVVILLNGKIPVSYFTNLL